MPPEPVTDSGSGLESFDRDVLALYRRGVAETELPADALVARSLIPAGTAARRDFSSLAPTLPEFLPDACTGCMLCVNVCPDSALYASVLPGPLLADAATSFSGETADAEAARVLARFTDTSKYGHQAATRGLEPAKFGLFVDATKCKGCAECVAVCPQDALRMIDKVANAGNGRSTVENAAQDVAFYRSLPPTPEAYRSDKVLADLMLGDHAFGYVGGAGSCAGCGEATAIRMMVAATRQVHGPDSMGIVAATGCNSVYGATYPFNPYLVPWTNSLFENAPADAMGIRARWDQAGNADRKLWVLGGDGAMYDIGFQSLSRMVASGADIKVLVLDTQVYSNTGGQASTASFGGQVTKLSAYGTAQHGRPERRKELGRILMSHGDVYVAQVSTTHVNHFYRAVIDANSYPGPAVVIAYTPCMPEHGIADDAGARSVKAAVDSRAFPLFTYDPRRGDAIRERLSLAGNPSIESDWQRLPHGEDFDFVTFARGEGRFAPHFDADGAPAPEILATQDDRLANWRTLQELAGIGHARTPVSRPTDFAETSATMTAEDARAAATACLQCPDPTCVAACPIRIDIPRYLEHVAVGDFAAAAQVLAERNPMARVTSRVCEQERQCEGACKRATGEGEVPIRAIERFVAEWARSHAAEPASESATSRRVAIVGAGPAGLACAGELARRGHDVTVFDAYHAGGGILRYGIPGYRLPRPIVDDEVDRLRALGVRFALGVRIGESETIDDLRDRHDAVFVAVGVGASVSPGIPGEELAGVVTATEFLERVNRTVHPEISPRARSVVVVGGGNVAMDAARSALRLGATSVTVVYRRGRAELPACSAELREAEAEGARFVFLASPIEILGDADGRVRGLRCERMALGAPDASGRARPVPSGEELELAADQVILALGSRAEPWLAASNPALDVDDDGRPLVRDGGASSMDGVYAGGDVVRGAATVVEALGDGMRAAEAIDRRLRSERTGRSGPIGPVGVGRRGMILRHASTDAPVPR
jgi:homotetrameric NADPH-dependent glutamate synthase